MSEDHDVGCCCDICIGMYTPASRMKRKGLGDILERELKRLNITPEAYIKLKARFGAMPICSCEKRKQWLNKVGQYLGIGT